MNKLPTIQPSPMWTQRLFASRLWNGWSPGIRTIGATTLIAAFAGALMGLIWENRSAADGWNWLRWYGLLSLICLPIAGQGFRRLLWVQCAALLGTLYFGSLAFQQIFHLSHHTVDPIVYVYIYVSFAVPLFAEKRWGRIVVGHLGLLIGALGIVAGYGLAFALSWQKTTGQVSLMSAVGWCAFAVIDYFGARWFPPNGIRSMDLATLGALTPAASLTSAKGTLVTFGATRALAGAAFLIAVVIPPWLILRRTLAAGQTISPGTDARPAMEVISQSPWKARSVRHILDSDVFVVLNEGESSDTSAPFDHAQAYCNRLSEVEDRQSCYATDGTVRNPCDGYQTEEDLGFGFWLVLLSPGKKTPPSPLPPSPPMPPTDSRCPAEMAYIPAGKFRMGSEKDDKDADEDESPAHEVTLTKPFCLDVAEVTVAKYRACTKETRNGVKCASAPTTVQWAGAPADAVKLLSQFCNGDRSDRDEHPINCVDWNMADTYCKWAGGALPTEAQWEYAARGKEGRKYPWGNEPAPGPDLLNACGSECRELGKQNNQQWAVMYESNDGAPSTAPVRSYAKGKTPEGVFDLAGNVWEWVADVRASYTAYPVTDPLEIKGNLRVLRGGGWYINDPRRVRAAYRDGNDEGLRDNFVGFRCVRGQNQ